MAGTEVDASNMSVEFDVEEDVLYVNLRVEACGYLDERPNGILLRRSNPDADPDGITAHGFRSYWFNRRPEFYEVVASYLDLSAADIERATEKMLAAREKGFGDPAASAPHERLAAMRAEGFERLGEQHLDPGERATRPASEEADRA